MLPVCFAVQILSLSGIIRATCCLSSQPSNYKQAEAVTHPARTCRKASFLPACISSTLHITLADKCILLRVQPGPGLLQVCDAQNTSCACWLFSCSVVWPVRHLKCCFSVCLLSQNCFFCKKLFLKQVIKKPDRDQNLGARLNLSSKLQDALCLRNYNPFLATHQAPLSLYLCLS